MTDRPPVVRPPAVAGAFYPADPHTLRASLRVCFADSVRPPPEAPIPRALIVPHAGYLYSGAVAASAYRRLEPGRRIIRRVVLLGPSHRAYMRGVALSGADAWRTPLGSVPLDTGAAAQLRDLDGVAIDDGAHAGEHSLEVQVPFLQTVLDDFALVPLVVGDASADQVATVLDALWAGPDTVVVVSTDLSHHHRHAEAVRLDAHTAAAIVARRIDDIADEDACGSRPLRGLLRAAAERRLAVEQLDLRNSGDTAGDEEHVVGYGAFAVA